MVERRLFGLAATCFEKSGDRKEQLTCEALQLALEGQRQLSYLDPNKGKLLFEKAALKFQAVNDTNQAATCFFSAQRYAEAATLFADMQMHYEAATCYQNLRDFARAAASYKRAGMLMEALQCMRNGRLYDVGLELLHTHQPEIAASSVIAFATAAAKSSIGSGDKGLMSRALSLLPIPDQQRFLRLHQLHHELAELLKQEQKYQEAADIFVKKLKKVDLAAECYKLAGNFVEAAKAYIVLYKQALQECDTITSAIGRQSKFGEVKRIIFTALELANQQPDNQLFQQVKANIELEVGMLCRNHKLVVSACQYWLCTSNALAQLHTLSSYVNLPISMNLVGDEEDILMRKKFYEKVWQVLAYFQSLLNRQQAARHLPSRVCEEFMGMCSSFVFRMLLASSQAITDICALNIAIGQFSDGYRLLHMTNSLVPLLNTMFQRNYPLYDQDNQYFVVPVRDCYEGAISLLVNQVVKSSFEIARDYQAVLNNSKSP